MNYEWYLLMILFGPCWVVGWPCAKLAKLSDPARRADLAVTPLDVSEFLWKRLRGDCMIAAAPALGLVGMLVLTALLALTEPLSPGPPNWTGPGWLELTWWPLVMAFAASIQLYASWARLLHLVTADYVKGRATGFRGVYLRSVSFAGILTLVMVAVGGCVSGLIIVFLNFLSPVFLLIAIGICIQLAYKDLRERWRDLCAFYLAVDPYLRNQE